LNCQVCDWSTVVLIAATNSMILPVKHVGEARDSGTIRGTLILLFQGPTEQINVSAGIAAWLARAHYTTVQFLASCTPACRSSYLCVVSDKLSLRYGSSDVVNNSGRSCCGKSCGMSVSGSCMKTKERLADRFVCACLGSRVSWTLAGPGSDVSDSRSAGVGHARRLSQTAAVSLQPKATSCWYAAAYRKGLEQEQQALSSALLLLTYDRLV
jgi:hypothetical protein